MNHTSIACKICGSPAGLKFGLPSSKKSGHEIPDVPDDAFFFECDNCGFLFTPSLDDSDHTAIYDEEYWTHQDPDLYGRVGETLRLVMVSNELVGKKTEDLQILDFGCGGGAFVEVCRRSLQMQVWGTDIIRPKYGLEWFLPSLEGHAFDAIIACEVIEHLPDPKGSFELMKRHLKPGGTIAFQTAYWDSNVLDRTWWYLGPGNGHISHYAPATFDFLADHLGVSKRRIFNNYPGLQAWQFL